MTTALVMDPGLSVTQGHNYNALLRIKAELSKLGVKHACLASIRADAAVRTHAAPVLPEKGLWWRAQKDRAEFLAHSAEMGRQLSLAFDEEESAPDLLVLNNCDAVQVQALALALRRRMPFPVPHVVIWLLFPELPEEYRGAFAALRQAIGDVRKISVYCETTAMAASFSDLIGLEVGVAPGPNLACAAGKSRSRVRNAAPKVVSAGVGNTAKGYHLLPGAIERVLQSNDDVTFRIHCVLSNSNQAGDTTIFKSLSKMGRRVRTSNAAMTSEDYLSYLLQADLLLLPYDEKVYRMRGSGIFNEARALGIPIVATRGCSFAQPAFDQGWGVEITERSGNGIAEAILTAVRRLPDLAERAAVAAKADTNAVGLVFQKAASSVIRHDMPGQVRRSQPVADRSLNALFSRVELSSGAALRGRPPVSIRQRIMRRSTYGELSLLANAIIDTSPVPYLYSVLLHVDEAAARRLEPGRLLIVEVFIEVLAGAVGMFWGDERFQTVPDSERYAPAMEGSQRIIVSAPADRARYLVLRNVAADSTATSFRVPQLTVRAWSMSEAEPGYAQALVTTERS